MRWRWEWGGGGGNIERAQGNVFSTSTAFECGRHTDKEEVT